jgi:hypothetical protein
VDDAALPNGSALAKATAPVKGAPAVALTLTPVADSIAAVTVSLPLTKAKHRPSAVSRQRHACGAQARNRCGAAADPRDQQRDS